MIFSVMLQAHWAAFKSHCHGWVPGLVSASGQSLVAGTLPSSFPARWELAREIHNSPWRQTLSCLGRCWVEKVKLYKYYVVNKEIIGSRLGHVQVQTWGIEHLALHLHQHLPYNRTWSKITAQHQVHHWQKISSSSLNTGRAFLVRSLKIKLLSVPGKVWSDKAVS